MEQARYRAGSLKVACFMMQRDEDHLVRPWVSYHAALFGMENLFVFDNGSTSEHAVKELQALALDGLNVDWHHALPDDYHRKGDLIGAKIRSVKDDYDFFIPLDCDEFFVLKTGTLEISCDVLVILEALKVLRGESSVLCISEAYYNILGYPAWYWCWPHNKTFFAESFEYLDHGYHSGRSESGTRILTDFAYVHYHHKPYDVMVAHAKNKLRPYVDVEDPVALALYQGTAHHCVKSIRQDVDTYMKRFSKVNALFLPAFSSRLLELGIAVPFG